MIIKKREPISHPVEPPAKEAEPFELPDPNTSKKKTHTISLKLKRNSRAYHKIFSLDDNNDLDLTIQLV